MKLNKVGLWIRTNWVHNLQGGHGILSKNEIALDKVQVWGTPRDKVGASTWYKVREGMHGVNMWSKLASIPNYIVAVNKIKPKIIITKNVVSATSVKLNRKEKGSMIKKYFQ